MAGGGADEDNPVPVNVVALIDILMCLLLFYMVTSKFPTLEMRMDAWLPQDKGAGPGPALPKVIDDIRVRLSWEHEDVEGWRTVRRFGSRIVKDDAELTNLIVGQYQSLMDTKKPGAPDPAVIIEASAPVPWKEVVHVMDLCRLSDITKIEFAFTADAAGLDLPE